MIKLATLWLIAGVDISLIGYTVVSDFAQSITEHLKKFVLYYQWIVPSIYKNVPSVGILSLKLGFSTFPTVKDIGLLFFEYFSKHVIKKSGQYKYVRGWYQYWIQH